MGGKCIKVQFGQPTLIGQYCLGMTMCGFSSASLSAINLIILITNNFT